MAPGTGTGGLCGTGGTFALLQPGTGTGLPAGTGGFCDHNGGAADGGPFTGPG